MRSRTSLIRTRTPASAQDKFSSQAFSVADKNRVRRAGRRPTFAVRLRGWRDQEEGRMLLCPGSARVPACNLRRLAGNPVRRDAEHHTRDAYAPQKPIETFQLIRGR